MSYTKLRITFVIAAFSIFLVLGKPQNRPLPFPHLTNFSLTDIGIPVHTFEGIDYDQLPENLRNEYNDCYGEHYKCIRFRTHHTPVCGYDMRSGWSEQYHSQCDIELQNCRAMVKAGKGIYGKTDKDRIVFYMGEGYKCEHYVRRYEGFKKTTKGTI